jgi:hypothetical protein
MTRVCALCGKPAQGYAQINDDWFCHPDDESLPDCYAMAQQLDSVVRVWLDRHLED